MGVNELDLLLEDAMAILTRSTRNVLLNIYSQDHESQLQSFLRQPQYMELRKIYESECFFEFFTKCDRKYVRHVDLNDFMKSLLPGAVPYSAENRRKWYPAKICYKNCMSFQDSDSATYSNALYAKIEQNGSKSEFAENIEKGKIFGLSMKQTKDTTWMFQEHAKEMVIDCRQSCKPCEAFNIFLQSDYNRLIVMQYYCRHLITNVMNKCIPGIQGTCHGNAKGDAVQCHYPVKYYYLHGNEFVKITISATVYPQPLARVNQFCPELFYIFNKRINMLYLPGSHQCQFIECENCPMMTIPTHCDEFYSSINLRPDLVTTCQSKGLYGT